MLEISARSVREKHLFPETRERGYFQTRLPNFAFVYVCMNVISKNSILLPLEFLNIIIQWIAGNPQNDLIH